MPLKSVKNKKLLIFDLFKAFKQALKEFIKDGAFHHGAALAYYTLFAFIPIIYLTTSIYERLIGSENMRKILAQIIQNGLGIKDSSALLNLIDSISFDKPNLFLEIFSTGLLLYTCSAFMISLKRSLNEFFNVNKKNRTSSNILMEIIGFRFLGILILAFIALLIILLYFIQIVLFSALTSWLSTQNGIVDFSIQTLHILFTLLTNVLIFSLIFKYMHNAKVTWKVARNGAMMTALLLYFSQLLIGYYLQHYFIMGSIGVANSIFIMLAWVHYSAQVVFFGAKYTYIIGNVYHQRIITSPTEKKEAS